MDYYRWLLFRQRLRLTIKLAFATDEKVIAELNKELKKLDREEMVEVYLLLSFLLFAQCMIWVPILTK